MGGLTKILMSIVSSQGPLGEAPTKLELITEGTLQSDGGTMTITYDESELIGLPGHVASITVGDGCITMERKGVYASRFDFSPMLPFTGSYDTPDGNLRIDVLPIRAQYTPHAGGGKVELACELYSGEDEYFSEYTIDYRSIDPIDGGKIS